MRKERVVGVIHQLDGGGAEKMMVKILNHFISKDIEVHLVIFKNIGENKKLLSDKVEVHDLNKPSVSRGLVNCLKTIYHIKPTIVLSGIGHLNLILSPFIPLMKRLLPSSRWIARETSIISLKAQREGHTKLFNFLSKQFYHHYDLVITQSEDMQNDLKRNYPKMYEKSIIINNPVTVEKIEKMGLEENPFSQEGERVELVTVGALRGEKQHEFMLELLTLLPSKYFLTIVGTGSREEELKGLAEELHISERVNFVGYQSNPFPYVKNADIFLLTSAYEGLPNVLLEANALGTPIVAFNCQGGVSEIIEQGANGFYVPLGDIESLKERIEKIDELKLSSDEMIEMIKNRYSDEIIFAQYEKAFLER